MNKFLVAGLAFGLLMILVIGCSDDDCATCPETNAPLGYGTGVVEYTTNGLWMNLFVYGHYSAIPVLDSARVGDSLFRRQDFGGGSNGAVKSGHLLTFYEEGDSTTYMYDLGDTAVITIWGEGRASTCRIELLSETYELTPQMISPSCTSCDTISQGESDTLVWHSVEFADYYAVMLTWVLESGYWIESYNYTTDTVLIVDGALIPDSTYLCYVTITPFNGPDPRTETSNWTGTLLDGRLFSVGGNGGTDLIVIPASPSPRRASPQAAETRPERSAAEIVANVYKTYGK